VESDFLLRRVYLKKWKLINIACVYRFKDIPIIKETLERAILSQNAEQNLKFIAR
jgi:hypothetical protein